LKLLLNWEKQVADLCPRQDFFESKLELRTSLGFLKLEGLRNL